MKKLLFLICTLFSINAFAQIEAAPPANGDDTTKYTIWGYSPYGIKMQRMFTYKVLRPPRDTSFTKGGLAIIGSTFYFGDETRWWPVTTGGGGTVTSIEVGHLSPLFTSAVTDNTGDAVVDFTLSNTTQYKVFGRSASGSGVPSYISLDTNFISGFSTMVRPLLSAGTGISYNNVTGVITNSGDLSTTNEIQVLSAGGTTSPTIDLSLSGGTITFNSSGIASLSRSGNTITITATEVNNGTVTDFSAGDLSPLFTTSEATTTTTPALSFSLSNTTQYKVFGRSASGSGVPSYVSIDTSFISGFSTMVRPLFSAGSGISFDNVTGVISNTGDLSATNELQSLSHTSDGDSHKVELSTAAGSLELIEGSNIALATGGSGANQTVTISSTLVTYEPINGLHLDAPDSLKLGGDLIENTTIVGAENAWDMDFLAIDSFSVSAVNVVLNAGAAGAVKLGGKIYYTTDISPTSIGANQNDYSPTDFTTASVLRLTSDASRNITGLAGGADGRTLKIFNVGSNDIVLKDQDANSTAANRFELLGDKTIKPGDGIDLWYDETTDRWRAATVTQQLTASDVLGKARITLTNSEGTYFELEAGTGVSISQSGSVNATKVTIEADLSSVVSDVTASGLLTSSGGTTPDISSSIAQARLVGRGGSSGTGIFEAIDVGGILSFSGTTLNATEVDGSTSNELQTLSGSGTSTPIITLSDGGGTFSITGAGIAVASRSGTDITITATEVDGSTSNELQTIANTSDATSHTQTLSDGGGSTQFIEGQNITLTTGGSGSAGTVTIAVDKVLASGTYSPTVTIVENASGYSSYDLQYLRVGNVVTVSGRIDITPDTDGDFMRIGITLPVASSLSQDYQLGGSANSMGAVQNAHLGIRADASNDRAEIFGYAPSSSETDTYYFTFTYLIL